MELITMKQIRMNVVLLLITLVLVLPAAIAKEASKNVSTQEILMYDFDNPEELERWRIVNDGVMGGLSKGQIVLTYNSTAIFKGTISLENRGGFASTRTVPYAYKLDGYEGILLRVKGDGKNYQFRVRTDDRFDGISYRYEFNTDNNTWKTIAIPFDDFAPTFRGRVLKGVEPVDPGKLKQVGFLIANKQAENFNLEIDWIKAYK
jgi:monofunctional biosynthetic peptidoglycan transglycosylase